MALAIRRQFIQQASLAAGALHSSPIKRLEAIFERAEQKPATPDAASIHSFASKITGRVITPEASEYESARSVINKAFDQRPAVIVRCAGASDVPRALDFAQKKNLPLAVRSGGHSRLGHGMCDGGVVIDLSGMKRVEVDTGKRVARAEAGALVRDLDEATQGSGLATTSGGCPTVGVAGLTLGGGEGRLMEKYSLACDNLLSAQVATVDGRQLEASQKSNADLFWAIRGGGGVVTTLEYQLHPVDEVVSGALTYPVGRIPELLQVFARFLAEAPDEMDAFAQLLPSEGGPRFKIDVCYCGDARMANDLVRPLRGLKPKDDSVKPMSYLEAQAAGGFLLTPVAHFQTNLFLRELSDAAIAAVSTAISNAPATCKVILVPLRGAVSRVGSSDTAFALRQPGYEVNMTGVWSASAEKADTVRWVHATRDSLQPFASGVYVNQLGDTSDQLVPRRDQEKVRPKQRAAAQPKHQTGIASARRSSLTQGV